MITSVIEGALYPYMISKAGDLGVYVYAIGGWVDHTHLVAAIPPKIAIADVVRRLKGASSHLVNEQFHLEQPFRWQRGYGVLTISEQHRPVAEAYVHRQKQHHVEHSSIPRLERDDEQDEGPTFPSNMIRDPDANYQIGNVPF